MKCIVIKKFFDPFLKRAVKPGESIEISDDLLKSYSNYVQITEPVLVKVETAEEEPVINESKPNKKRR